jgi:hypothetical protein
MKLFGILILLFLVIISILIFYFGIIVEGLTPSSNSPALPQTNPIDKDTSISPLTKFENALVAAFSPPAKVETEITQKPAWTNVKQSINPVSSCKDPVQVAVSPLPVDQQTQEAIKDHSVTVNSVLDTYEKQIKIFEDILTNYKSIIALNNSDIKSVVNLGIPTVSVNYDKNSNSLITLSVVKGENGDPGKQPDQIQGIGIIGDIGKPGLIGENPINFPQKDLPYWSR